MKIGLSVWSAPGGWPLEKMFSAAKKAGFDGVEVALGESGEVNLGSSEADARKVKALAQAAGVGLYSVATSLYWKYPLTSGDEKTREKAKSILKKQLEWASWLGCGTILVVPGTVGADVDESLPMVPYDAAYARALDAIKEAAPLAEKLGVEIGVENVWNKFLLSPLETRDFIDQCGSRFVGMYFDVGNVLLTGYPEQWIGILGGRIKKVHFKDFLCAAGNMSGFVDLLSGDVDYPAVMKAFQKIGYDGWATAEVGFSAAFPETSLANIANAMKTIVGRG